MLGVSESRLSRLHCCLWGLLVPVEVAGSPYAKEQKAWLHNVVTQEWKRKDPSISLTEVRGELIIIIRTITHVVLIKCVLDAVLCFHSLSTY